MVQTIQQMILDCIKEHSRNNKVRRTVIKTKMTYFRLNKKQIEEILKEMSEKGLIEQNKDYLIVKVDTRMELENEK